MKDLQTVVLLYDFYGPLLTKRQQALIHAYYLEDLSLSEIAGEGGVSRQAVHDLIKRSVAALYDYEGRLGLVKEHWERQEALGRLEAALQQGDQARALAILRQLQTD